MRTEWRKAEARKKKRIISAKREAWSSFINKLDPQKQPQVWSFVKVMLGKGTNLSPDGTTIKVNETTFNTPKEKAELFLDLFSSAYPSNIPENCGYQSMINSRMTSSCPSVLNEPITMEEIDKCLPKSKSRAVGIDLIHN